jgi:hypothetical protein
MEIIISGSPRARFSGMLFVTFCDGIGPAVAVTYLPAVLWFGIGVALIPVLWWIIQRG